MSVKNLLFILMTIFLISFFSGCAPKQSRNSSQDLETVMAVFEKHDLVLITKLSSADKITAAKQVYKQLGEHHEDETEEEHAHHENEKGIPFVLIIKATPAADGTYNQPILPLGQDKYFYEYLYTAEKKGNSIAISKSAAYEGAPERKTVSVEPEILLEIADALGGNIENQNIILP